MTMAETAVEPSSAHLDLDKAHSNNNHPYVANHNRPVAKQRKRKRLSQVLDKLTGTNSTHSEPLPPSNTPSFINNNLHHLNHNNNNNDVDQRALKTSKHLSDVFRFDSYHHQASEDEDVFSPASSSNKSPHSSSDSPRISFSPLRIKEEDASSSSPPPGPPRCPCYPCITGITTGHHHPPIQAPPPPPFMHPYDRFFPASPISPLTPPNAAAYSFERYLHSKYLPDIFRRRSHSDSELPPLWLEAAKADRIRQSQLACWPHPLTISTSDTSHHELVGSQPQESPLDLSMKSTLLATTSTMTPNSPLSLVVPKTEPRIIIPQPPPPPTTQHSAPSYLPSRIMGSVGNTVSVPVVKGDVASPTTKESVASRYNLEVSPVVEEMPPGSDVAYVCPVCGQMFSLHDRLAKHMASRHKSKSANNAADGTGPAAKAYLCEVCKRSFARSDMLTRHMRLHTGVKPYTCRVCSQVFSRSDHLSTHQRTHTGEKPYKCPQCPYAACRRDMITRHMRTHARYELDAVSSTGISVATTTATITTTTIKTEQ